MEPKLVEDLIFFDLDGTRYVPAQQVDSGTGLSTFRVKPEGASNKANENIKLDTISELATAMLVDGLPARLRPQRGGTPNFLKFGGQKLVSYELSPVIAKEIGVPAFGATQIATQADKIRAHVMEELIEPARKRGERRIEVLSGELHSSLKLSDALPSVCSVLEGRKLAELGQVKLVDRYSPIGSDKPSSTIRYTYELLERSAVPTGGDDLASLLSASMERFGELRKGPYGKDEELWGMMGAITSHLETLGEVTDSHHIKCKWSLGQGNWLSVPWIALYDDRITTSPQSGVYIVLLVAENLSRFYLTLNQGSTDVVNEFGAKQASDVLAKRAIEFRNDLPEDHFHALSLSNQIDLSTENRNSKLFEIGAIANQLYEPISSAEEQDVQVGLQQLLQAYEAVRLASYPDLAEDDLTVEHIHSAMIRFDEIGEKLFLKTYGFKKATKHKVYGPQKAKIYPAKAIVGAAHQFLPNGRPLSSKQYHGGYGEQQAVATLERLGFEMQDINSNNALTIDAQAASHAEPTNLIMYGPPGTGKTYHTAHEAVRLCNGAAPEDRAQLMEEYNRLMEQDRIAFVTFHQNFSYEDFVEGLRPSQQDEDGEQLESGFRLSPEAGIFRKIAQRAQIFQAQQESSIDLEGRRFFKISLGEAAKPEQAYLYDEAMKGGFVHIGDDGGMDWTEERFVDKKSMIEGYAQAHDGKRLHPNSGLIEYPYRLKLRARPGDIVIVTRGNLLLRAIGEIAGGYEQVPREDDDYTMRRPVNWFWEDRAGIDHSVICNKRFSQVTMYEFSNSDLKMDAIAQLIDGKDKATEQQVDRLPYVLIIDEINRANVSKVFGELITLIEPDKRLGQSNALTVKLPYSKQDFGVPSNLHIIGTMNTADRSIALLDTALRRRFRFKELAPDTGVAAFREAERQTGLPLTKLLKTMNERIEYLIDRDHRIGHAFFIGCETRASVDAVMRDKVIPLIQEYFFEDWSRVQSVLGRGFIGSKQLNPPPGIDGPEQRSYFVQSSSGEIEGQFPNNAYDLLLKEADSLTPLETGDDT